MDIRQVEREAAKDAEIERLRAEIAWHGRELATKDHEIERLRAEKKILLNRLRR
jgi:chromosome segregation ATPase